MTYFYNDSNVQPETAKDRAGDTNLIIAAKAGHKTIVDALIKRYADLDTKVNILAAFIGCLLR